MPELLFKEIWYTEFDDYFKYKSTLRDFMNDELVKVQY